MTHKFLLNKHALLLSLLLVNGAAFAAPLTPRMAMASVSPPTT